MHRLGTHAARVLDTALDRTVVGGYSRWGYALRRRLPGWPPDPPPAALTGRGALVTGASSGLGVATVAGLARLGARVILVVRDTDRGEQARATLLDTIPAAELSVSRCDVSDLDDVRRFAEEIVADGNPVDILVHNAGVMPHRRQTSAQDHELTLATHVLGPLLMTESLRPALRAAGNSRVIWVSSGGMYAQSLPLQDPENRAAAYRGAGVYARTKRVQVALVAPMARRWTVDGIAVHAMHPGWADTAGVASSMPGFHRVTKRILRDTEMGADTTVWLAAATPAPESGLFWHDRRPRPTHLAPWTRHTEAERAELWQWCARHAGLET